MRSLILVASMALVGTIVPSRVDGQPPSDSVLVGVRQVDARVLISWDERVTTGGGMLESQAKTQMSIFTLELRKLGLIVTASAPNLLWCSVNVLYDGKGLVLVGYSGELDETVYLSRLKRSVWATTWNYGGVLTVGLSKLSESLSTQAKECAERFGNAWLSANPRRQDQ